MRRELLLPDDGSCCFFKKHFGAAVALRIGLFLLLIIRGSCNIYAKETIL
jgi:hypothetical protein